MSNRGRGSNSVRVRLFNERVVLTQLRRLGQASKKELADASGLTAQAVVDIVDGLERDGLVRRLGKRAGRVGQPSTIYAIDPDGVFACGLRVGVATQDLVLVDFEGRIRQRMARGVSPPRFEAVRDFLIEGIAEFVRSEPRLSDRLLGLGVALTHVLWYRPERQGLAPEVLADWASHTIAAELKQATRLPVFVENDTRVAAIAEYLLGDAQELQNFLYVSIGTFISGALVLGGNLAGGQRNGATLGAIPVGPSRLARESDRSGERLNDRASLDGLIRHLGLHGFTIRAVSELPEVIDAARGVIQEWLDDCVEALAEGLTACFAVIDVEAVIIDSALPQFLVLELTDKLARRLAAESAQLVSVPQLRMSKLGQDAALLGSAILPVNAHFFPSSGVLVGEQQAAALDAKPRRAGFLTSNYRKN